MSAFQALVLGIVEGLTEFLPISSTGHLILAAKLLGLAQTEFQKSFEIVIQLGAIGAVVLLYWRQFLVPGVLARVLVAFLPTGAIGLAFYRLAKTYLLGNESVVLLAFFLGVHRHYERMASLLRGRLDMARTQPALTTNRFIVLVKDLGPATADAIAHLRAVRPEHVTPLYIGPPGTFEEISTRWTWAAPRLGELQLLPQAEEHLPRALRLHLQGMEASEEGFITVVLPEMVSGASWWQLLRQRKNLWLKASLLLRSNVVVMDVPLLSQSQGVTRRPDRPVERRAHAVLIPVSAVHEATIRAVRYAVSLGATDVEGLFFDADPDEVERMITDWWDNAMDVPLAIIEAPFRDIGPPLLAEIRKRTVRGDTTVTVVIPELVVDRWWENLLHNQTSLYIKRLLLLEPDVVVASVPLHIQDRQVAAPAS
jgi:hypothetical protein